MATLRVFIVGDDPLARTGLAALIAGPPVAAVTGQAAGPEMPEALESVEADVILWDLGYDVEAAIERLAGLAGPGGPEGGVPPVVAVVADEADAAEALAAGARGVLRREVAESTPAALGAALQGAASGLLVLDPDLGSRVGVPRERDGAAGWEELTPRELEVLQLLAEGLANKQIAQRLGVSDHTIKFHVNAILGKLGAHSRTEAVTRAARRGLVIL
jgi:DNA-binding NarL/FixJ family response regulator